MNVEAENAVMRERARIREAVVKCPKAEVAIQTTNAETKEVTSKVETMISLGDVLAILSSNHGTI